MKLNKIQLVIVLITMSFSLFTSNASPMRTEASPFTNISFGLFLGWGDFIKVENFNLFDGNTTHFLVEINGKGYKEIIKETKALYGKDYKCRLAEHFIETMSDLNIVVGPEVDLKLYLFDGGHEVIEMQDVPVTTTNLEEIQFETNFCE